MFNLGIGLTISPNATVKKLKKKMGGGRENTNLQNLNSILNNAQGAQVPAGQQVRDIPVREDFAGHQVEHGGLGDTAVAASDPEDLGVLRIRQRGEEAGTEGAGTLRPVLVPGEEGVDVVVGEATD